MYSILTQCSLHDLTAGAALNFNISVASVNMNTGTRQLMVPLLLFYSRMQMTYLYKLSKLDVTCPVVRIALVSLPQ